MPEVVRGEVVRLGRKRELAHLKTIYNRFNIAKLIWQGAKMMKADREQIACNLQHAESIRTDYYFYKEAYEL